MLESKTANFAYTNLQKNNYPGETNRAVASYYYMGPKNEKNFALALVIERLLNDFSILNKYGSDKISLYDNFENSIGLVITVKIRQKPGLPYLPLYVDKQIESELNYTFFQKI